MKERRKISIWLFCALLLSLFQVNAQRIGRADKNQVSDPVVIPLGLDAYRMWDQLYTQRIGVHAYMQ